MKHGMAAIALSLLLAGCIPPAPDFPSEREPPPNDNSADREQIGSADTPDGHSSDLIEKPVWERTPVAATSKLVTQDSYIVLPGDTLSAIGEKTGAGFQAIAAANGLAAPYALHPGQQLRIPTGRYHIIQSGESGIAIARAYDVRWAEVVAANDLSEPFILKVGQRLRIPGAVTAEAPSMEARAAAFRLDIEDILTGGEPAETVDAVPLPVPPATPGRPLPPSVVVVGPTSFSGSFGWPASGRLVGRFGAVGEGERNDGIELSVAPAAPVFAAADGVVAFSGTGVANYGGMILIRHGSGWISAYGRVASASVSRGQKVKRGQLIGKVGSGATPQLHFQLRRDRKPIDPLTQLPQR